ncbi:GMC oxidoreductase [Candidatus Pelagibacter sp.]|nr:GMC oxidoreductase [Candidatus Pelagibacter sp.]
MIFDLKKNNLTKESIYDVCIFGAGPAGISLALKLQNDNKRILICEAGDENYSEQSQNCYKGIVKGDEYFDLDVTRLRYLGGSSNHWGGWCRTFNEMDFNRGDIGEYLIWPIEKKDIDPFFDETVKIIGLPKPERLNYRESISSNYGLESIEFDYSGTNFNTKYINLLKKSKNIDLLLNANLKKLIIENNKVKSCDIISYNFSTKNISAKNFVFAMGGIENSRQLLWQQKINNENLYDTQIPVGKYWMEHPHYTLGNLVLKKKFIYSPMFERSKIEVGFIQLKHDIQKKLNILSCGLRLEWPGYTNAKQIIADLACYAPKLSKEIFDLFNQNLMCAARVRAAWEQLPVIDNKIVLSSNEKDKFNIPRPILNWKKNPFDRKTIKSSLEYFSQFLLNEDMGRLQLDEWIINNKDYPTNDEKAGHHHMGGTRMHDLRKFGVVDRNCKVYGSNNLYCIGSSIFTTGGHNNPTFPIVQLSLRLGEHLSKKII